MKTNNQINDTLKSVKSKKILNYTLIAADVALTLFLFVVSIIMLATMPKDKTALEQATGFIGYLQKNPLVYLYAFVIPLFALLIVNVIYLVIYIKKTNEKKKVQLKDLSEEEKARLKAELLKDVNDKTNLK